MSGLAEEINRRFNGLISLKPSFSFLENHFAVGVVSDGCPVSTPITKDTVELELLELREHERPERTQTKRCSRHTILEKYSRRK